MSNAAACYWDTLLRMTVRRIRLGRLLPLRALSDHRILVAFLAVAFAVLAIRTTVRPISDPDVWWVAAAGRDMVLRGAVPTRNFYSFADGPRSWVMHEWLYAAPYQLGLEALGPAFLVLVGVAGGTATLTAMVGSAVARSRHPAAGAFFVGLVLVGGNDALLSPRPAYLSMALAAAMSHLAFAPGFGRRHAAACVLLELVWANAHGSFPLGIGLLVGSVLAVRTDRWRRLAAAGAASLITVANPYGLELHALVVRYIVPSAQDAVASVHSQIVEFAPLWRGGEPFVNPMNISVLVVVIALALWAACSRRHRMRGVLVLAIGTLAVLHVRHVTLTLVIGCILLGPVLDDVLDREGTTPTPRPSSRQLAAGIAAAVGLALAAMVGAGRGRTFEDWIHPSLGGPAFVRLSRELADGARAYAPFGSSGLLIWLTAPRGVRVLFDPRNDCYSREVAEAGLALGGDRVPIAEVGPMMDRLAVTAVIVPAHGTIGRALAADPDWSERQREGGWVRLDRTASW